MVDPKNREKQEQHKSQEIKGRQLCYQAGYLPVPLRSIPPQGLDELKIFLYDGKTYKLYRNKHINFTEADRNRLLDSGVEFVYVSVSDHQEYYRTIERYLGDIVSSPSTQIEKKSEILYSTSLELAKQVMLELPKQEAINRTQNITNATVKMIIGDNRAFDFLFKVFNHDFYTATHMVNVCSASVSLAYSLGLMDKNGLHNLGTGAILHDIGKIFISSKILNCTETLTKEQFDTIKTHVEKGYQYLSQMENLSQESLAVVYEHHERMDGSGYPRGLRGDEISLMGRLTAIVDTFEAMTSVRPYRKETFSVPEALEIIESQTPDKYDRELVLAFKDLMYQTLGLKVRHSEVKEQEFVEDEMDSLVPKGLQITNPSGRRHYRHYFRIQAHLTRISRTKNDLVFGNREKVIIHNISRSGIGLLSARPLFSGQIICISIPECDSEKVINFVATVIRCVDHADGWYTIGAQFHEMISAQMIEHLKGRSRVRQIYSILKE